MLTTEKMKAKWKVAHVWSRGAKFQKCNRVPNLQVFSRRTYIGIGWLWEDPKGNVNFNLQFPSCPRFNVRLDVRPFLLLISRLLASTHDIFKFVAPVVVVRYKGCKSINFGTFAGFWHSQYPRVRVRSSVRWDDYGANQITPEYGTSINWIKNRPSRRRHRHEGSNSIWHSMDTFLRDEAIIAARGTWLTHM